MSLSNIKIYSNKLCKRHVDFQMNSVIGAKLFKYLGGDNLVYKNYTIEDQNSSNYAQLYNVSGVITTDNVTNINNTYLQYGYELLPKFSVIMFSGTAETIPAGWLLCDGRTSIVNNLSVTAPDLRGRFVLSLGQGPLDFANNTVGATGGEQNHTLTVSEMPSHSHTTNVNAPSVGLAQRTGTNTATTLDSFGNELDLINTTSLTINNTGGGDAHNNMPPYYVLCYIMKGF